MQAGELNRQITFRQKTVTYNSYNEPIETWADAFTVWSQVITKGGTEFYAAQKLYAETSAVFKIRNTARVRVKLRIKFGGRTFAILGINEVNGMRKELLISCKEVI